MRITLFSCHSIRLLYMHELNRPALFFDELLCLDIFVTRVRVLKSGDVYLMGVSGRVRRKWISETEECVDGGAP